MYHRNVNSGRLCIIDGEGNGTPLQYSCLENPMDGGAWWAPPWGREELDMTKRLHFHFSLSCVGEGNVNPLQCSYLENSRDWGAWWAAVYGVAQSRTRLKQLSSDTMLQCYKRIKPKGQFFRKIKWLYLFIKIL